MTNTYFITISREIYLFSSSYLYKIYILYHHNVYKLLLSLYNILYLYNKLYDNTMTNEIIKQQIKEIEQETNEYLQDQVSNNISDLLAKQRRKPFRID